MARARAAHRARVNSTQGHIVTSKQTAGAQGIKVTSTAAGTHVPLTAGGRGRGGDSGAGLQLDPPSPGLLGDSGDIYRETAAASREPGAYKKEWPQRSFTLRWPRPHGGAPGAEEGLWAADNPGWAGGSPSPSGTDHRKLHDPSPPRGMRGEHRCQDTRGRGCSLCA